MLSAIVSRLAQLDTLTGKITAMARRHLTYGIRPATLQTGKALLWTPERGLGTYWNVELKDAWQSRYKMLFDIIHNAASEPLVAYTKTVKLPQSFPINSVCNDYSVRIGR